VIFSLKGPVLAKTNYSFEKRQRELEKKRKQEAKRLRKLDDRAGAPQALDDQDAAEGANNTADTQGSEPGGSDASAS